MRASKYLLARIRTLPIVEYLAFMIKFNQKEKEQILFHLNSNGLVWPKGQVSWKKRERV